MLASKYDESKIRYPTYVQPKLRGLRALYKDGFFWSRDLKRFNAEVVKHIVESMKCLPQQYTYDGEFYVHGWNEQRINGAIGVNRKEVSEDTLAVQYWIYDIVDTRYPFVERLNMMFDISMSFSFTNVQFVQTYLINNKAEVEDMSEIILNQGYEGIMYRDPRYPYECGTSKSTGRSWGLMKRKKREDAEFVVSDVLSGDKHKRYGKTCGKLECITSDGSTFTVSGGLDDERRARYWKSPSDIVGKTIKVEYDFLTRDGIPHKPTIILFPD